MLILSCALILYFGVASYYVLLYLGFSFADPAPWSTCGNWWNTASCRAKLGKQLVLTHIITS